MPVFLQVLALLAVILLVSFRRYFMKRGSKLAELREALALARGNTDTLRSSLREANEAHALLTTRARELAAKVVTLQGRMKQADAAFVDVNTDLQNRERSELRAANELIRLTAEAERWQTHYSQAITLLTLLPSWDYNEENGRKIEETLKALDDENARFKFMRANSLMNTGYEKLEREQKDHELTKASLLEEQATRRKLAENLERVVQELKATQASLKNKRDLLAKISNPAELLRSLAEGESFELFHSVGAAKIRDERDELRDTVRRTRELLDSVVEERDTLVTAKEELEASLVALRARAEAELAAVGRRSKARTYTPKGARSRGAGVAPKARKVGRS